MKKMMAAALIAVMMVCCAGAMADEQFLVRKYDEDGKTRTTVEHLDRQQRIEELARMVGGADSSSSSGIAHAASLLEEAEERKKELRLRIEKKEG